MKNVSRKCFSVCVESLKKSLNSFAEKVKVKDATTRRELGVCLCVCVHCPVPSHTDQERERASRSVGRSGPPSPPPPPPPSFHIVSQFPAAPGEQEHRLLAQQLLFNPPFSVFFICVSSFFGVCVFCFVPGLIWVLTFLLLLLSFSLFQVRVGFCRHRRRCCWKHGEGGEKKTRWTENGATKEEFFLKPSDIVFFFSFFFYRFLTLDCRITDHARRRPPSCPSCDPTSSADATLSTTKTTTKSSDFILARRTQASKLKPEECEGEIQGHDLWR